MIEKNPNFYLNRRQYTELNIPPSITFLLLLFLNNISTHWIILNENIEKFIES